MQSFLNPGQQVLTFNWAYVFSRPKIGDVIVFKKDSKEYIKRVQKIQGNQIYVLGDNAQDSQDSRAFGSINKSDIVGKVIYMSDDR